MNKISILETAQAIIDMSNEIESLKTENVNLRDRLIHAQSETLAAIQQNEPKPEPRDIGHENVVSFVTRKSGELQVSPGIVWGLIMDLIAKNPNHFGTDADACPDPIPEPGDEYGCGSCELHDEDEDESEYVVILNDVVRYAGKLTTVIGLWSDRGKYKLRGVSGYLKKHEFEFVQRAI